MMSFPNDLIHDGVEKWILTMKTWLGELPTPSGKDQDFFKKVITQVLNVMSQDKMLNQ